MPVLLLAERAGVQLSSEDRSKNGEGDVVIHWRL